MVKAVAAIVLWTARIAEVESFYRGLGFPLREERHEGGPAHWACELGGVHFAIYPQEEGGDTPSEYRAAGASLLGFQVDSLDETYLAAKRLGAGVLIRPEEVPWGRRAVILDPDGRTIELNEPRAPSTPPPA